MTLNLFIKSFSFFDGAIILNITAVLILYSDFLLKRQMFPAAISTILVDIFGIYTVLYHIKTNTYFQNPELITIIFIVYSLIFTFSRTKEIKYFRLYGLIHLILSPLTYYCYKNNINSLAILSETILLFTPILLVIFFIGELKK